MARRTSQFSYNCFHFHLLHRYSQFSSDDTDDHSMQSKHKHKSHSRADDHSGSSRKRAHENEECNGTDVRNNKSSSKHSKSERHHHRSR